jgi:hypothetical protein
MSDGNNNEAAIIEEMPIPGNNVDISTADDFLQEASRDTTQKNTVVNDPDPDEEEEPADQAQPKRKVQPVKTISAALQAKLWINLFDMTQTGLFTVVHTRKKKRELGENEDAVEALAEKLDNKVMNMDEMKDHPLYAVYRKFKRREKIIDDLPISDDERANLQETIEQMIVENGYVMPAWMGVSLALSQVLVSRTTSAFVD